MNPNACLLKSTTEQYSKKITQKNKSKYSTNITANIHQTRHSMWHGLALMTSSAIVQMNIHDSTISHVIWIFTQKEDFSSEK